MKLFAYAAAAALALMTGVAPVAISSPATASPQRQFEERTVVRQRTVVRRDDRRSRPRYRTRTVCRNVFRNGHRNRVCRTVRR